MASYYDVLDIDNQANQAAIKKAYKRLAVKYHPDKNTDPDAEQKFKLVKEAYETLSNPHKRSQYDNPVESILGHIFGNQPRYQQIYNINLTLEEVYNGKIIKLDDMEVEVMPGVMHGTKTQHNGKIYSINIKEHAVFKRANIDLMVEVHLTAIESMFEKKIEIQHLDGSTLAATIGPGSFTGELIRQPGKGMPQQITNTYGDLYIKITIDPVSEKELTSPLRDAIMHVYSKQINNTLKIGE